MAITRNDRGFGISKYGIELQHTMAGFVKEVSGGDATADVVAEKLGSDHLTRKHLGPLKYEEINFKCGTGMSSQLYEWIKTGFNQTSHTRGREDGAILFADFDNTEVSRLTWQFGLITEFGMPALDASSKDSAMMTLKFAPETTRKTWAGGGKLSFPADAAKQKKWLPSNFRIRIDGLEIGCAKVNKIEALTVKQKVTENAVGEHRDYQKEPTSVEIPNLVLTLAESHADEFYRWHEDFVIKGNNGQDREKGGTLEYLTPNLQEVLFTLTFSNLGVFKVTPDKVEASAEPIRRLKVEMYCEDIKFDFSGAAIYGQR
jgi:phage tail-like protein